VAVKEWEDKIIFLHKIVPGGTDDSYGIYVAKLAGIPNTVIQRSKKILSELESQSKGIASRKPPSTQYNLFTEAPPETNDPILEEIRDELELICINTMTPIEAMNRLNKLKEKLNKSAG
jgi:DNA mismatch repair protein MutS